MLAAAGLAASSCARPCQLLAASADVSEQSHLQRLVTQLLRHVLVFVVVSDAEPHGPDVLLRIPRLLDLFGSRLRGFEKIHQDPLLGPEMLS